MRTHAVREARSAAEVGGGRFNFHTFQRPRPHVARYRVWASMETETCKTVLHAWVWEESMPGCGGQSVQGPRQELVSWGFRNQRPEGSAEAEWHEVKAEGSWGVCKRPTYMEPCGLLMSVALTGSLRGQLRSGFKQGRDVESEFCTLEFLVWCQVNCRGAGYKQEGGEGPLLPCLPGQ